MATDLEIENTRLLSEVERLQIAEIDKIARNIRELKLIEENARLREALGKYANHNNWHGSGYHERNFIIGKSDDKGWEIAETTLKGKG